MSEIATLEKLEIYLSHAPNFRPQTLANGNHYRKSALESYFSEIRYSSFQAEEISHNASSAKLAKLTYKTRVN